MGNKVFTDVKLTFGQRLNYALCEFGYNAIYYWVSSFMLIYYTDIIGVSLGAVSMLTMFVRIFDAVNDPIIGSFADRTRSKWGRYRPWIAICGPILAVTTVLLFAAQPGWSDTTKIVYMWIVYIVVTLASTGTNMPFAALNGVITSDSSERNKLGGLRMVFGNLGMNFTGVIAIPLIVTFSAAGGAQTSKGYFFAVLLCAIIGVPFMLWTATKVREVIQPSKNEVKIPLTKQFAAFFKNKYAIITALSFIVCGFYSYGRMGMMTYYFTYVSNNPGLISLTGGIGIVTGIIGSGFLTAWTYDKIRLRGVRNKGFAIFIDYMISAVLSVPMFFLSANEVPFWIFYAASSIFSSAGIGIAYGLIGDCTDYGEYKQNVRVDGFIAAFNSLMMKVGGAIGPAVLLIWIEGLGYVANTAQNPEVLGALNFSITLLPAIALVIIAILFLFYNLDEKRHAQIKAELDKRRAENQE